MGMRVERREQRAKGAIERLSNSDRYRKEFTAFTPGRYIYGKGFESVTKRVVCILVARDRWGGWCKGLHNTPPSQPVDVVWGPLSGVSISRKDCVGGLTLGVSTNFH